MFDESILAGGLLSEIVEVDANRTAVFVVKQHNPAMRKPLEDVREEVATSLETQESERLMDDRADAMLAALAAGEAFAAAAEQIGATAAAPTVMTRDAQDVDQSISVAVFTALKPTQGAPTTGSTRNSAGGFTVYSVDAVIPGRPEAIPLAERDAGKLQLADQSGLGDFIAFVQALRADADIVINEDMLAAQDYFQ